MSRFWTGCLAAAALSGAAAGPLAAQDLATARRGLEEGYLRFSYATAAGVHGDAFHDRHDADPSWTSDCRGGPARVQLELRGGAVAGLDLWVGGRWRDRDAVVVDVGTVGAAEAADFLLDLVADARGEVAEDAVLAACIADSVEVWPRLLALARDPSLEGEVREACVFWLGQAAGEKAVEGLGAMAESEDEDLEIRRKAVFSLAQIEGPAAFGRLRAVATGHRHPRVRKEALFWLAQRDEEEVLAVFEEILTEGP